MRGSGSSTESPVMVANTFWAAAETVGGYPRNIERAVALSLPVAVVKLPKLNVQAMLKWLQRHGVHVDMRDHDNDLMGGVVAHRGYALLFVCGGDTLDEQRLTVAHETAHILEHYLRRRAQVIEALGDSVIEVLDGDRLPTTAERAQAVISGVRVGAHIHLLPRSGKKRSPTVDRSEREAEALAMELVAPNGEMRRILASPEVWALDEGQQCALLAAYFGIPARCFADIVEAAAVQRPQSFVSDAVRKLRGHNAPARV